MKRTVWRRRGDGQPFERSSAGSRRAARLVIDAKLDLAMDRDEQLAIFANALEVARLIEQHYQSLSDAGIGTSSELQRAKLARVTVEVQILKLKRQP